MKNGTKSPERSDALIDRIVSLAAENGGTESGACEACGVVYRTWKRWKRDNPAIAERIAAIRQERAETARERRSFDAERIQQSQPVVGRLPNWPPTEIDGKREPDWMRKRREGTAGEPTAEEVAEIDAWWKLLKEELARRNGAVGAGVAPNG